MGGVWEAFLRVGGRLQLTKICVFCWLFHSNGRRETEGDKGGNKGGKHKETRRTLGDLLLFNITVER